MILQYIIWHGSPSILQLSDNLDIRWYSLFFALGFIISQQIGAYIFKKDGLSTTDFERLTLYMILATILGARLGHVLFYDFAYFMKHPIEIFLPVTFTPTFKFVGYQGLASHGAAFGILTAIFLFASYRIVYRFPLKIIFQKQKQAWQKFFWVVDRVVIVIFLAGSFIRLGNFMNSEIIGKPTKSNYGVLYFHDVKERLFALSPAIRTVSLAKKIDNGHRDYPPVQLTLVFDDPRLEKSILEHYLSTNLREYLSQDPIITSHIYQNLATPLQYTLHKNRHHAYTAVIDIQGIPRHPAQLYEIASLLPFFFIFFFWWKKKRHQIRPGILLACFLVIVFGFRFFYEFFKEHQVDFEKNLVLNMGQILSIPLVLAGICFLVYAWCLKQRKTIASIKD